MATKRQTARQKVMELIERYGATLYTDDTNEIEVEAPAGYIWAGSGLHSLVAVRLTPEGRWRIGKAFGLVDGIETKADLWLDLLDRMTDGVEPCTDSDCDWCHPTHDDDDAE